MPKFCFHVADTGEDVQLAATTWQQARNEVCWLDEFKDKGRGAICEISDDGVLIDYEEVGDKDNAEK